MMRKAGMKRLKEPSFGDGGGGGGSSSSSGRGEVSERRQVGDAEAMVNQGGEGLGSTYEGSSVGSGRRNKEKWWRDVGMEEGL